MRTWTMPEVEELNVTLTANGVQGNNDEKHQDYLVEQGMQGNNPGKIKDDSWQTS